MKITVKVKLSRQQALEFLHMVHDLSKSREELANYISEEWNFFTHRFLTNLFAKYAKSKEKTIRNSTLQKRKSITFNFTDEEALLLSIIYQLGYVKHPYREAILRTIHGNTYQQLHENKSLLSMADTLMVQY